jgi:hypothetical protein
MHFVPLGEGGCSLHMYIKRTAYSIEYRIQDTEYEIQYTDYIIQKANETHVHKITSIYLLGFNDFDGGKRGGP